MLKNKSNSELRKIIQDAEKLLNKNLKKRQAEFAKSLKVLIHDKQREAEAEGFDWGLILSVAIPPSDSAGKKTRKNCQTKTKAAQKYKNPDDPSKTWSGRGRPPLWAASYKEAGTLHILEITKN